MKGFDFVDSHSFQDLMSYHARAGLDSGPKYKDSDLPHRTKMETLILDRSTQVRALLKDQLKVCPP